MKLFVVLLKSAQGFQFTNQYAFSFRCTNLLVCLISFSGPTLDPVAHRAKEVLSTPFTHPFLSSPYFITVWKRSFLSFVWLYGDRTTKYIFYTVFHTF